MLDPRRLKPAAFVRLLNSTPRGTVIGTRQLRRHRERAGYAIGDDHTVDLFRYAAWLTLEYLRPPEERQSYEDAKRKQSERNAERVAAAQDIGEIPPVADPERRAAAERSLLCFCETYFPDVFYLPWSPDHLLVIERLERVVRHGGLFAVAMPRGSGKTLLCQMAVLWSALTGATPFVCLIAASAKMAVELMEKFKVWLETNDRLGEDFPEVCFPIRKLERITNRQRGQKYNGEPTRIEWVSDKIVLPTIAGSKASGVVISCSGMEGSHIRGQNHARPDGTVVRPQLVLVDDPQTRESAQSPSQCREREAILSGDVLGMAGPGKKIAGLMTCTVIRAGDLADTILDRDKHPEWQGERRKMVYAFPSNDKRWAEYGDLWAESLRAGGTIARATAFYREHRAEMDAGASIAWPERFNPDELSAIQHAVDLKLRDEAAFFAEYQNEPLVPYEEAGLLTAAEIAAKTNGRTRGDIPGRDAASPAALTMLIDVQQKALYWTLVAWEPNFTGYVVDYNAWPDQRRAYFTLRDLTATIARSIRNANLEGQVYGALDKLTIERLGRAYRREDGAEVRIDRCLIDANWGQATDVVYQFCRQSQFAGVLLPSHGRYVGAARTPFSEYHQKRGDQVGLHWIIPARTGRVVRRILIDTDYWKSFVYARLAVAMGDPGCLSLFGRDAAAHQLIAEHITAEACAKVSAQGRVVDEWKWKESRPDNHWFDCLVGCAVAANLAGATLPGVTAVRKRKRERVDFGEWQRRAREGR